MAEVVLDIQNFQDIIQADKPVIVDFWAEWCAPCRMVAPVFEKLSEEFDDRMVFGKLNVDENSEIAARYSITGIPTMIIFKGGAPVDQIVGALPEKQLRQKIENNL